MNNPKNIIKFITVFIMVTTPLLLCFYTFRKSEFKNTVRALEPGQNQALCKSSSGKPHYSLCLRRYIPLLVEKASPIELTKIIPLIESVKEQDLKLAIIPVKKVQEGHITNIRIFQEHLSKYSIDRSKMDFFQIIFKPVIEYIVKGQLKK